MLYLIGRFLCAVILRLCGVRLQVLGRENIPLDVPLIIASNHASHLDPPLIGIAASRKISFMARHTLFKIPVFGWILPRILVFPVKRAQFDKTAMRTALDRLSTKHCLGIFPQGTRSATFDRDAHVFSGISFLAEKSDALVLPVYIDGTAERLPRNGRYIRPGKVTITFGKPVSYKELTATCDGTKKEKHRFFGRALAEQMHALKELPAPEEAEQSKK